MRRVWTRGGAALALLAVTGWGWILHQGRDLASVDESGLLFEEPPVTPDENGAVKLQRAAGLLEWPGGPGAGDSVRELRTFSPWDRERARDLVERNEASLVQLERAARASQIEISPGELIPSGEPSEQTPFVGWHRLLEIQSLRAALRMTDGDPSGAIEDVLATLRLGDAIHRSRRASLPHALLGLLVKNTALSELHALLPYAPVDRALALRLISAIDAARGDGDSWARIWGGEYREMRNRLRGTLVGRQASPGWLPPSYVLQPNRTLERLADLYRGFQRNSRVVCSQMEVLVRTQPFSQTEKLRLVLSPNSIGNVLFEVAVPRLGVQRKRCDFGSSASLLQVAVALKARLDADGELPLSLDDLVPDLLETRPRDGVYGEPLRYARAERVLYARGGPPWRLPF